MDIGQIIITIGGIVFLFWFCWNFPILGLLLSIFDFF